MDYLIGRKAKKIDKKINNRKSEKRPKSVTHTLCDTYTNLIYWNYRETTIGLYDNINMCQSVNGNQRTIVNTYLCYGIFFLF